MKNQIFNEDNIVTMGKMPDNYLSGVICSPPYNMSNKRQDMYYNNGYADLDSLSPEEYLNVRINEFKEFQRVVKDSGVILYNLSYMHENPVLPYQLMAKIHDETDLTVADVIFWKKYVSIPFQTSSTKLSRIVEPIYVIVHKDHLHDFDTNKSVSKINEKTGQKFYKNYLNFIEAKNNDGFKSPLKATYSTELITKLIDIYFTNGSLIYDPFLGIGTTALGCRQRNCDYIGSEIKKEYYDISLSRISVLESVKVSKIEKL